jgi:large subunit ribosomal protein L18
MSKALLHKLHNRTLRATRVRSKVHGTAERPRLSVNISNLHVTAQLIDDDAQKTLIYVTTVGDKKAAGSLTAKAELIGKEVAQKAKQAKLKTVIFDLCGKLYEGRIKALADAARAEGLEF